MKMLAFFLLWPLFLVLCDIVVICLFDDMNFLDFTEFLLDFFFLLRDFSNYFDFFADLMNFF